ncbi:hypothetical protein Ami103574_02500 [Aminipila butyrica]|uniref:Uncharacterized protein n=1 Tax=Aminipila butyrica TaxID=433296 RepID=A0A858BTI6_9FIRM|nr:hypothetical protein [Aminipila butyrica]QIB68250.1 hypothetical protein Ami103574_02500 [Aminipila butyrica]
MNDTEAIQRIKEFGLHHAIQDLPHSSRTVEAFEIAIQALQEKAARENPRPLTLEQLKERIGKPVWITDRHGKGGIWAIVVSQEEHQLVKSAYGTVRYFSDYGLHWLAYDHEPKEAANV